MVAFWWGDTDGSLRSKGLGELKEGCCCVVVEGLVVAMVLRVRLSSRSLAVHRVRVHVHVPMVGVMMDTPCISY